MMKKYLNFRALVSLTLAISLLFTTISCDKEKLDLRPDLPPIESLVMDFEAFSDPPPGGSKGTTNSYENFAHSYFSVLFWNVATTITMALPVVAYGHLLLQTPVYVGDQTWEWKYDFTHIGLAYTATLTGARISNEEFSMEMAIALTAAPDQGVKWFDGVIRYDHTHATWNLYKDGSVKILQAEWNMDFETEEGDLTYTYMEEGHEQEGSYIMLAYVPTNTYDASYTISLAANETVIEWMTTTIEGRVKDQARFGDTDWHCWDSQANGLVDKVCDQ